MSDWYKEEGSHVLRHMKSDGATGLTEGDVALRLKQHGPNELMERGVKKPWKIFLAQFSSNMVMVLMAAGLISAALGDFKNAVSIGAIVLLNALLGYFQENRAEKAMGALKRLAVPADGRLVQSVNMRVQEAILTGESAPVEKDARALGDQTRSLNDRANMVYSGTFVTYGRGLVLVTETGMATELGRIAAMIQSVPQETTPLEKRLNQIGNRLALIALGIVGVIFVLGLWRGEDIKLMFLTAVSIAVAAIPEGLPAIVTINLAVGSQRMLRRNALIRRLPAVETLGSVTVICTDKTGTLTENKRVELSAYWRRALGFSRRTWNGSTPAWRNCLLIQFENG